MVRLIEVLVWVALLFGAGMAGAEPLAVGDRLEAFSLEDQHGVARSVDTTTELIVFSRDMEGGKLLKEAFEDVSGDALGRYATAYVADISGMPKLVAKLFALPSMRRRPYPMLLDREGDSTARLPDVEGQATLIFLENLEIERVEHLGTAEAVRRAVGIGASGSDESS